MSFGLSRGKKMVTEGVGMTLADLPALEEGKFDPRVFFENNDGKLELEIGSGKGTFLVQHAPKHPETRYFGIEWAAEFYRYAADRIRRHGLTNVKLLHGDAVEFIKFRVANACVEVIHVYFSDPWPKKRHHKRRVVQDDTLREFHRVLVEGGKVHLVTDHDDLWAWYEEHAARNAELFERIDFEGVESASEGEVVGTNFERKYQKEGRNFRGMTLVKR